MAKLTFCIHAKWSCLTTLNVKYSLLQDKTICLCKTQISQTKMDVFLKFQYLRHPGLSFQQCWSWQGKVLSTKGTHSRVMKYTGKITGKTLVMYKNTRQINRKDHIHCTKPIHQLSFYNTNLEVDHYTGCKCTGGELRNGVNVFLTSYATDSVRFSQQILDI